MTLASAQLRGLSPQPAVAQPTISPCRSLAIAWEISPRSLKSSQGAVVLNGHASRLRTARVIADVEIAGGPDAVSGCCTARVRLIAGLDGGGADSIDLSGPHIGSWAFDEPSHRLLLDVPGVLHAVAQCDDTLAATRVVYARTRALTRTLGLPGGVYDAPTLHTSDS